MNHEFQKLTTREELKDYKDKRRILKSETSSIIKEKGILASLIFIKEHMEDMEDGYKNNDKAKILASAITMFEVLEKDKHVLKKIFKNNKNEFNELEKYIKEGIEAIFPYIGKSNYARNLLNNYLKNLREDGFDNERISTLKHIYELLHKHY